MKRNKPKYSSARGGAKLDPLAIPKEMFRLGAGWLTYASVGIPWRLARSVVQDSSLVSWSDGKVFAIVGDAILSLVNAWGPLYGKAMQIWLSRLDSKATPFVEALNLGRVYGDWPPMDWRDVQLILDREIPQWRDELTVESRPMGVASMSQVHAAVDASGHQWVIKFLKPASMVRMTESIAALETAITVAEPFAVTRVSRRFLADARDLCAGLKREMDLDNERNTMLRVQELILSKRQKSLRVPILHPRLFSRRVIVMERLYGIKLSDVVSGKAEISDQKRKVLAKKLLGELLVQIFEWGLFHADPHAGNLMLLDDGTVGLYDWGLAGELLDSDRRFIAGILRAIMAMDIEKLIDVLADMSQQAQGKLPEREKIRSELRRLIKMVEDAKASGGPMPSLNTLVDAALEGADRLGIPIPNGLLMMAKSLLTVEGLARGIDAEVPLARVAGPVLFRAADPGFRDFVAMAKQLPNILSRYMRKE
jgi:ubiquinone biosynthesis protein